MFAMGKQKKRQHYTSLPFALIAWVLFLLWKQFFLYEIMFVFFFISLLFATSFVLGIADLLKVNRKQIKKSCLAGVVLSALFFIPMNVVLNVWAYSYGHETKCRKNLKPVVKVLKEYALSNDGRIPDGTKWCDLMMQDKDISSKPWVLFCNRLDLELGEGSYGLNENVVGKKLADLPSDTVLLFDSTPGWNQIGGADSLQVGNHRWGRLLKTAIVYVSGDVEFVKPEDIDGLRWGAAKEK
jgi:hypothetical protein